VAFEENVMKVGKLKSFCMIAALAAVAVVTIAAAMPASAQTFSTLYDFNYTVGLNPRGQLVQAKNGLLYGTTGGDLINSDGTIFEITPGGTLTTITFFGGAVGEVPYAGLIQATNGDLYGTTQYGGTNGDGVVFEISPGGTLTTLHSFDGTDGSGPVDGLIQATNGHFYGTTQSGGADGYGTVFSMTASGTVTTLHSFTGGTDGAHPYAGVVQGSDGNFYGTAQDGGADGYGVVFKMTPSGAVTTLYSFNFHDPNGGNPLGGLLQGATGDFYGTASAFGANNTGTVFKITSGGALTLLYTFCSQSSCADGNLPYVGLLQGSDGNFYGSTEFGGDNGGFGTIFKMTPSGTLTVLHSFNGTTDGSYPEGVLVEDTDGTFYGSTVGGGSGRTGTVYSLSTGLGKIVSLATTSGAEGARIGILGQGFSTASVVRFGGVEATTIQRTGATFIDATVPAGALTGKVTVTTGSKTLSSPEAFKVKPTSSSFTPPSGAVGTVVTINGTGLMQTTRVAFNGTSASFTVVSDTEITATVPTGATTGKIVVTTEGGSIASAASFRVN
jgi:uncharacterized repeat protein (TIGR03803 family)